MNDIVVSILKNGKVTLSSNEIGYNGENKARNIIIKLEEFIEDGTAVLEVNQHNKKYFLTLQEQEETFVLPIHESLLAYSEIEMQFRLVKDENIIIKSEIFKFEIDDSINAIDKTIPEEYSDWFVEVSNKLNDLEKNSATKEEIKDFIKKDVTGLQNYYDKTEIDTKTENFITNTVDNLVNYYKKTETYSQEEINQKINDIKTGRFKNVDQLPETGEEYVIYLVPAEKSFANNIKNEYIWLSDTQTFELIGSTQLDLSDYITTEMLNQKLQDYITSTEVDEKIDEETRDLLQGLSRELKHDEENGGFSAQTIVNVKNKSGATEMIMEIDNLDITTNVPTNSVLGTLKGQDLEERLKNVEEKEETDPTVPDYVKSISEEEIEKWNKDYTFPIASSEILGGVKIGEGVNVSEDGTISVKSGGGSTFPFQIIDATGEEQIDLDNYLDFGEYIIIGNNVKQFSNLGSSDASNISLWHLSIEKYWINEDKVYQVLESVTSVGFNGSVQTGKYLAYRQIKPTLDTSLERNTLPLGITSNYTNINASNVVISATGVSKLYDNINTALGSTKDNNGRFLCNSLTTESKELIGAINEVNTKILSNTVIEIESDITEESLTQNEYPKLQLTQDQINKIVENNVTILKLIFNVQKTDESTETYTMIFYTTIDNVTNKKNSAVVQTIKINAVRVNDEGTIVYHGELLGDGSTFAVSTELTAKYIPHTV